MTIVIKANTGFGARLQLGPATFFTNVTLIYGHFPLSLTNHLVISTNLRIFCKTVVASFQTPNFLESCVYIETTLKHDLL